MRRFLVLALLSVGTLIAFVAVPAALFDPGAVGVSACETGSTSSYRKTGSGCGGGGGGGGKGRETGSTFSYRKKK